MAIKRSRVGLTTLTLGVVAGFLAGCSATGADDLARPDCRSDGRAGSRPVVLAAQAVPTASRLACVRAVPAGWTFGGFTAFDGQARFWFTSGESGTHVLTVTLTRRCVAGGRPVAVDARGAVQLTTRVGETTVDRRYAFPGGCLRYQVQSSGASARALAADASLALGVLTRDQVRAGYAAATDGRLSLDPPKDDS